MDHINTLRHVKVHRITIFNLFFFFSMRKQNLYNTANNKNKNT